MKFGLEDRHWQIIVDVAVEPLKKNHCKVWVLGSRATGKSKKFSDLDILFSSGERVLPPDLLRVITESLEESMLPIKVIL